MHISTKQLRIVFGITAIPLFCMLTGCRSYYKATNTDKNAVVQNISSAQYNNRFFILRNGASAYYMSNVLVSEDRTTMHCHLEALPPEHYLHLINGVSSNRRYKKSINEQSVLNEVHFYIPTDTSARTGGDYTLALNKVEKVEVIEKDNGRTTSSYVLGGLGIAVGALAVGSLIALALKSSCPFVSAYNDNQLQLQGEIYGGAIYPQLCRNDYIGLRMSPTPAGKLQLQISNELKENQFTDVAELLVITHDKNIKVVADEKGNLHSVALPVLPNTAIAAGKNIMPLLQNPNDDLTYKFDDTIAAAQNNNHVVLSFTKPINSTTAKLVLRLKNSYWLDMVYGKFTLGFGNQYDAFMQSQRKAPVEKLNNWKQEQQLPLTIAVQTGNGWQTQQTLTTFGPLANRETAIPIDISQVPNGKINVQLSCGFMFWEIDYAAIDFSNDATTLQVAKLLPQKATDETGKNVLPLLLKEDNIFLEQPLPGNAAIIEYAYTPLQDTAKTQTYILHAKGYYEHIREYTNAPDMTFLQQFKQPAALSNYSMALYKKAMQTDLNALVKQ
ncbi:hypothetical protein [Limnovirga soli]|uniref:Uncharacterized protein n=1 Tax=Limnovirga soli TaxID=2656915 RepID=A0A8J8FGD8_9BACT|nr:hypothetical protein [Limnovirga soli]NNV55366.1 hypothetical protein [Limnovirga soli]